MLPLQRKQAVMAYISKEGTCTISSLSGLLGVSEMTIRRDLKLLEDEGLIERTHGGAVVVGGPPTDIQVEPAFDEKKGQRFAVKDNLARYAVKNFVQNDSVLILEGGTTVTCMARYLNEYKRLTVITNGLNTLTTLKSMLTDSTVLCCGGMLRDVSHTFVGPLAEEFFLKVHVDAAFFSASGLTLKQGYTDPNILERQIKKVMASTAKQKIMLLDSSKLGSLALLTTFALNDMDVLITDQDAPKEWLEELQGLGLEVHVV